MGCSGGLPDLPLLGTKVQSGQFLECSTRSLYILFHHHLSDTVSKRQSPEKCPKGPLWLSSVTLFPRCFRTLLYASPCGVGWCSIEHHLRWQTIGQKLLTHELLDCQQVDSHPGLVALIKTCHYLEWLEQGQEFHATGRPSPRYCPAGVDPDLRSGEGTFDRAVTKLKDVLGPGHQVKAAQDFWHTWQGDDKSVGTFIRWLEQALWVAHGSDIMTA